MTTQDLIKQAKAATFIISDGWRQYSDEVHGIQCEIITRNHPGTYKTEGRPDTTRIQFWNHSERISRAKADEILDHAFTDALARKA